jgi:hypothetical protein
MSTKNTVFSLTIISILAIVLFINPSMNQSVKAEQVNYKSQTISFQDAKGLIKTSNRIAASNEVIAQYFGKDIISKMLAQPGLVGIQMYYGKNVSGQHGLMLNGVDKNGNETTIASIISACPGCPKKV